MVLKKEDLLKTATLLYEETLSANSYLNILKQYIDNVEKYEKEMQISLAFYNICFNALIDSLIMTLARLYDTSENTVTISYLLHCCKDSEELFRKSAHFPESDETFYHRLTEREEPFFQEDVEKTKHFFQLFDTGYNGTEIEMTASEYIDLQLKILGQITEKTAILKKYRNKIYAHNDRKTFLDKEIIVESGRLLIPDMEELTKLSYDICSWVIIGLSGVVKTELPINIDDWEISLQLVRERLQQEEDGTIEKKEEKL